MRREITNRRWSSPHRILWNWREMVSALCTRHRSIAPPPCHAVRAPTQTCPLIHTSASTRARARASVCVCVCVGNLLCTGHTDHKREDYTGTLAKHFARSVGGCRSFSVIFSSRTTVCSFVAFGRMVASTLKSCIHGWSDSSFLVTTQIYRMVWSPCHTLVSLNYIICIT